ncbi:recombinase family protein [Oscillospiraceae bacterium 38-13]
MLTPLSGRTAAVYLRKSRMEEGLETEEVLRRHHQALDECARLHGLDILEYFSEVVSGESLYARPQMLRLLEAVEAGRFDAVLCMDLDRLSRGRMKDQGVILDAFRESGTLIITPDKVYDLSDEMDDELAEFKTFLSRREYKLINKRLRRGLQRSIQEGCYVANAPYGYRSVTLDRRPTLKIFEPEAQFVRMMFNLYAEGYGCVSIANQINAMGARPHRSAAFSRNSVAKILRNPAYIGKIVWNQKTHIKKNVQGNLKHITIYNPRESWTITDGLHPAIVDKELYQKVQDIFEKRYRPAAHDGTIKSPLAGLVKCGRCGGNMQRMTMKGTPYLLCPKKGCCAATKFELVEQDVLSHLEKLLSNIEVSSPDQRQDLAPLEDACAGIAKEISSVRKQKTRLHELLELGEYDLPTYRERMAAVMEKLSRLEHSEEDARLRLEAAQAYDPEVQRDRLRSVLASYQSSDAAHRNALLHSVLENVTYFKEKKSKPSEFTLEFVAKGI